MRTETDIPEVRSVPPLESAHNWYVIHCKTGKEKSTSETLRINPGLIVYLPEKKVWKKDNACFIPLFPGYFFIQADLQKTSFIQISTCSGVLRILGSDGTPHAVPSYLVETLCAEITRLNEYDSIPNRGFRPGDTLHVVEGPFRGLESVFIGPTTPSKRVQVLFNFLGRLTKAKVEISALEKHEENSKPGPRQVRYTRGRGRKIRNLECL